MDSTKSHTKRPKNRHAVEMGRLGGKARKAALTPAARRAIARYAAIVRWAKGSGQKVHTP